MHQNYFAGLEVTMGVAYAYGVFYRALREALLSDANSHERLAQLLRSVKHLQDQQIPDEQIRKRFTDFIEDTARGNGVSESIGLALSAEEAADYLEQALSLFGAIAMVYGQATDDAETHC
jgi:hypothetical protein